MSDSGDEDVPKLGDKRVIIGRRKKMKGLRKSGDWTGERELTFIYKDARKATLAQLAVDYADGRLTYPDLLEQVPLETNWLRASENQKRRCAGRKTLLVLGWCPIRDGKINLDADPRKACFTEQWIMALERLLGEPVLMIDFFHDCKRHQDGTENAGCMGGARWPQENVVHAITMQVELNVAIREFGIQIVDVLGFAKSFIEEFDAAIFSSLEWAVTIPRCYLPFHLGKVKDLSFEKKKLCVQRIIQSLAPVTGVGMKDAYEFFKNFFAEHDVKVFRLPDWDIAVDLALCNNVTELLSTARTPEAIATTALTLTTPIYDSNPNLPELTVKPKPAKDITSTLEAAATRRFAIKPVTLKDALTSAFKDIFKDVTLPNTVADKVKEASYKTHIKRPRVGAIKDIPMGVQPTYDTPATSMSANDGVKDSFFKHSVYKNDTPFSKFSKAATVMIHDTATRDISTDSRVEDSFFKHDIHRNNTLPSRSSTTDTSTQNTAMSGIFTNDTVEDSFFKHGIHRKNTLPGRPSTTDTPTQNTAMSGIFTNNTAEDSFFKYGIHRNGIPLSKSSMAGTLTSDAFNGDTIMEDSFMGDTRTNDSLIDATFIAQAFMSETRIRKTRSNEVSNGVSNEVPGEVSNEASNEVLDEVSNQRGLDGEYPRGPPERMWTPLKRDMAAATVLLANYGLSVSPPAITHPYTWTDTATSKDLTEEQKAQKNKAQTIASDERRRALAVENFSRLKEARDALKMVDIEFACASLTKLCP